MFLQFVSLIPAHPGSEKERFAARPLIQRGTVKCMARGAMDPVGWWHALSFPDHIGVVMAEC